MIALSRIRKEFGAPSDLAILVAAIMKSEDFLFSPIFGAMHS